MADRAAILIPKSAPALSVANYVKLGQNLGGRDKLMRFFQYGARVAVHHLGEKSDEGKRLQLLQKALGLHRKAFKLGMFLDEAQKFVEALTAPKMEDLERYLTVVQRLAMTIFVVLDNILYLTEIKILDSFDKALVKMRSYQFRLLAAVASLAQVVLAISKQQAAVDALAVLGGDKDKLEKAREKQGLNLWKTLKNGADVLTYANSAEILQKVAGKGLDEGTNGVVGALSSLAGIIEIWITKL